MMRACHMDTCPVGIATQNPELRDKFSGSADYVVNFMKFVAEEVREYMALLGIRTVDELVGRTDLLEVSERAKAHWKAQQLDLSVLLYQVSGDRTCKQAQDHQLEKSFDIRELLPQVEKAIIHKTKVDLNYTIANTDRVVGTIIGSEISKKYGASGLPDDSITLRFKGAAGQSFGAYIPQGMTMFVNGDVNDYFGKGISGGKLVVTSPLSGTAEQNVIAGNVALYGATNGSVFINGRAGERFAVRNSGADVIVEGIGDHGCEYMTGGRAVILGDVGKNFGAGMSGGIAYVLVDDIEGFKFKCNMEMIGFEKLQSKEEIHSVRQLIMDHYYYTRSTKAMNILDKWEDTVHKFVKVVPNDYKKMLERIATFKNEGLTTDEAAMKAFLSTSTKK